MNIEEIRAREQAATPGPWRDDFIYWSVTSDDGYGEGVMRVADMRGWGYLTGIGGCNMTPEEAEAIQKANSSFIAHARQDIPALLKEIDRLNTELEQKNRELEGCQPQRWIETAVEMCGGIGKNYWVWVESSKRILLVKYDGDGWFQDGVISIPCTDVAYWMPLNLPELPYEISEVNKDAK